MLATSSCGPRVETYRPNEADLSKYNSFAFLPNAEIMNDDDMESDKVNESIIATLNKNMREQGYTLDRDNPDLLLLLSVKTDLETETTTDPVYASDYAYYGGYGARPGVGVSPYYNDYYYRGYTDYNRVIGYDTDTYTYKQGTLVVDVVDRKKRKTVWKGISRTPVTGSRTDAVISMVDEIFEDYPVKS